MTATTTIIIPVYNGERFLAPLLDSLLAQSARDWHCICVNDGSTDGSASIIEKYASLDKRIRLINQENAGCGAARNAAMANVTTPYLMFADQDDLLHPQAVEIATAAIRKADVDCLLFGFERFAAAPTFRSLPVGTETTLEPRNGTRLITGRRDSWPIFVWRHIFRTHAVRPIPFPPISGGEDRAWMCELSWNNLSWASIEPILYFNRDDLKSRSRGLSEFYIKNVFDSYRWIRERATRYAIDPRWVARTTRHMALMFKLSIIYRRFFHSRLFGRMPR